MSQAEVGRLSGLDQQRISTLEREGPPRLDVARRLADALGTTIENLYPQP
jgi:transcriptional regulator with XRE-family HTH domain